MIKVGGSLIILFVSTSLGFRMAARYVRRTAELGQLQVALKTLESEIGYTLTPLPEALLRVGALTGGPVGQFFSRAGQLLAEGQRLTVAEAWTMAIREAAGELALKARDLQIILDLGNRLGGLDREGQKKYLEQALARLWQEELASLEGEKKYVRLWRYLGFAGGLAVILLLL